MTVLRGLREIITKPVKVKQGGYIMNAFGKIEAILNDKIAIISSSETLTPNEIVAVFASIDDPKLKELGYSDPILYPKGELKIVCEQKENKYLAEVFRETQSKTRKIVTPSPFATSLSAWVAQLQPVVREITEEVQGAPSAKLNTSQSFNLQISDVVSAGDLVGRLL
jgi:hypothetical protein